MYFIALLLTLQVKDQHPLNTRERNNIAPAFLSYLRTEEPLCQEIYMTVEPLQSDMRTTLLRLTIAGNQQNITVAILNRLTSQSLFQLGSRKYDVEAIDLIDHKWAGL